MNYNSSFSPLSKLINTVFKVCKSGQDDQNPRDHQRGVGRSGEDGEIEERAGGEGEGEVGIAEEGGGAH